MAEKFGPKLHKSPFYVFCIKKCQRKNGLSAFIQVLRQIFQLSISNKYSFSLISFLL